MIVLLVAVLLVVRRRKKQCRKRHLELYGKIVRRKRPWRQAFFRTLQTLSKFDILLALLHAWNKAMLT
jgi:ribosomal 50S subunit-associated protein YjgA (DUF615 family)